MDARGQLSRAPFPDRLLESGIPGPLPSSEGMRGWGLWGVNAPRGEALAGVGEPLCPVGPPTLWVLTSSTDKSPRPR